jgi:hypothetical protein
MVLRFILRLLETHRAFFYSFTLALLKFQDWFFKEMIERVNILIFSCRLSLINFWTLFLVVSAIIIIVTTTILTSSTLLMLITSFFLTKQGSIHAAKK